MFIFHALRSTQRFHHFRDRGEWRQDHHFDIGNVAEVEQQ